MPKQSRRSKEERDEIMARIQAPKVRTPIQLDSNCTFRPTITDRSREIASTGAGAEEGPMWEKGPRWMAEKQERNESKKQEAIEFEMSQCTFKPDIGDPARFANVQAKFLESGYERFQNQRKLSDKIKQQQDEAKAMEEAKAQEAEAKRISGGGASPRRSNLRGTPTSPRFSRQGLSPSESTLGYRSAEEVHIARARAAREQKAAREDALKRMGTANEAHWQSRKPTTTPKPFCSHTGLRRQQRKIIEEERALVKSGEAEQLFKELHQQLHSLDLGGPSAWLS